MDRAGSVVLLHGVQSSSRYWWRAVQDLQDLKIEVRALDLLGHAGRTADGPLTLQAFADDVADQFSGQRADLVVGHSLGALVALVLGRDHPELAGGVLLEDPPALGRDLDPRDVAEEIDRELKLAESPTRFQDDLLAAHRDWSRRDASDDLKDLGELDAPAVTSWLRAERWNLADLVDGCRVPVHLLAAIEGRSGLTQPARDQVFEQLSRENVTLLRSNHQIQRERPALWLLTVLRQLDSSRRRQR